ncbi:MAG TPA: glycosyl hydrolase family 28-related protein, partial [Candidatus Dormibacteraeota bacterium]|nr:glycosyl hydrolase family 28-related protein [Candidatus Dormibacteraeota bacterium]
MIRQFIASKRAIVILGALAVVIGGAALLIAKQYPAGFTQSPSSSTCVKAPHKCDASGRPIPSNGAAGVNPGLSATVPSANAFIAPPAHAFIVTTYGADATGQHDATAAIQKTIQAAEAAGSHNTVYFPAGTYLLNRKDGQSVDFAISGDHAPNLLGAGRDFTKIVEKVGTVAYPGLANPKTVFTLTKLSGTRFRGLTVDTQTYNA